MALVGLSSPRDGARAAELLRQCGHARSLLQARRLHSELQRLGLEQCTFVANQLVRMYGRCGGDGGFEHARAVFQATLDPNVFSWTIAITAYRQCGRCREALAVFWTMDLEGVKPNKVTFVALLSVCCCLRDLKVGIRLHERVVAAQCNFDSTISTAIITMYAKCRDAERARSEFADSLNSRSLVAWNAMLAAYARNSHFYEAVELYERMRLEGITPDVVTFRMVLSACQDAQLGKSIHDHAIAVSLDQDVVVGNSILNMYARLEDGVQDAERLFHQLHGRNEFSWTIMVQAYVQRCLYDEALHLFYQMDLEGLRADRVFYVNLLGAFTSSNWQAECRSIHDRIRSFGYERDIIVGTAIISMYARCGLVGDARKLFERLDKSDVVLWNSMMTGYAREGQGGEALLLFHRLNCEGVKASEATFTAALDACSSASAVKSIAEAAFGASNVDLVIWNALLRAFGKLGCLTDAKKLFDAMGTRNAASWTAMVEAYARQGYTEEAMVLLEQMDFERLEPTEETFSAVLQCGCSLRNARTIHAQVGKELASTSAAVGNSLVSAYGKSGSVDEATRVFESMDSSIRNVVSWNRMIEAYVLNGYMADALKCFSRMEQDGTKPTNTTYAAVLRACTWLGAVEKAVQLQRRMMSEELQADRSRAVAAAIKMLGLLGNLEEASQVFEQELRKPRGCSQTEWEALLVAYAQSGHVDAAETAFWQMQLEGYRPSTAVVEMLLVGSGNADGSQQAAGWRAAYALLMNRLQRLNT